jgi:hypothetical protein
MFFAHGILLVRAFKFSDPLSKSACGSNACRPGRVA